MNKSLIKTILCIILASIIIPVIIACFYAVPSADDFSSKVASQKMGFFELLHCMFQYAIGWYKTWQGTYFGAFLIRLPLYELVGINGYRAIMLLVTVLFIMILFFLISELSNFFTVNCDHIRILVLFTLSIFYLTGTNRLDEIFYWFTGMCIYTIPLCCVFFSIVFYLKSIQNESFLMVIFGAFMAFCAAGGALCISGFLCSFLLLLLLIEIMNEEKSLYQCIFAKKNLILLFAIIGSVLNAMAPGNFKRHAVIDSEIRISKSIGLTFLEVHRTISKEFREGWLFVLIIIAFLIGFSVFKKSSKDFKNPWIITIVCYFSILITVFPVVLGYSAWAGPGGRCAFVEHISILINILIPSLYWGGWAAKKNAFVFTPSVYFCLILICLIPISKYFDIYELREITPNKMIWHLCEGDYSIALKREESLLEQIIDSDEEYVTVYARRPGKNEWTNIKPIGLAEDPEHWINRAVASYFGKAWVRVEYFDAE